jgi:CDP-diacylglycerol---glycerol-3-phosphate 3-phosphatidyltransferase
MSLLRVRRRIRITGQKPGATITIRQVRRQIPNILTLSRLAFAVAFFAVLTPWRYSASAYLQRADPDPWLLTAMVLFIIAASTDFLDGYLARKWNVVSVFGRIMDPFADKVLVIGAFIYLAGPGFAVGDRQVSGVYPWMAAVILARELLITSIRAAFESRGVSFAATTSGKLKMILQSICIPGVLLLLNLETDPRSILITRVIPILTWATTLVTVWSAVPYIVRAVSISRSEDKKPIP